ISDDYPEANLVTYDGNAQCLSDVQSGNVDAMTADDVVLRGYVAANDGLKVVGETFSEEPFGVGIRKGEIELRDAIDDGLEAAAIDGNGDLKSAWEFSFGTADGYQDPKPERD